MNNVLRGTIMELAGRVLDKETLTIFENRAHTFNKVDTMLMATVNKLSDNTVKVGVLLREDTQLINNVQIKASLLSNDNKENVVLTSKRKMYNKSVNELRRIDCKMLKSRMNEELVKGKDVFKELLLTLDLYEGTRRVGEVNILHQL